MGNVIGNLKPCIRSTEFKIIVNLGRRPPADVFSDYVILRLKESKTDPFRKGIDIKLFKIDGSICPFSALRKYLSVRTKALPALVAAPDLKE
jgi:hypothetical protein